MSDNFTNQIKNHTQMKSKKTNLEIAVFDVVAGQYQMKMLKKENRLCEMIKEILPQIVKAKNNFRAEQKKININCCLTVKEGERKGALIKDFIEPTPEKPQGDVRYIFDAEGEIRREELLENLIKNKVEFEICLCDGYKKIMETLTAQEKEAFAGFVLPPLSTYKK